jgi:hypothetical protein
MQHLITLSKGLIYLCFAGFCSLFFLLALDAISSTQYTWALLTMLILSSFCVVVFEVQTYQRRRG